MVALEKWWLYQQRRVLRFTEITRNPRFIIAESGLLDRPSRKLREEPREDRPDQAV